MRFPLGGSDFRYLVKSVDEKRFKNNMPTVEFVHHFKKRRPELTEGFAGNIKNQ